MEKRNKTWCNFAHKLFHSIWSISVCIVCMGGSGDEVVYCIFTDLGTAALTHQLHDYSCMWTLRFIRLENNTGEALMFRFSTWLEYRDVLESRRGGTIKSAEADVVRLLLLSYIQSVQLGSVSQKINRTFERIIPPALKHDVFSK